MDAQKTKQPVAGVDNDLNSGTWYKAACSGLWYRKPGAAGDVMAIKIDGRYYEVAVAVADDSEEPSSADRGAFDSSDWLDFLGRLENEFERREEHWRNATGDPYGIAQGLMVAMAEIKESLRTVTAEVVARKSNGALNVGTGYSCAPVPRSAPTDTDRLEWLAKHEAMLTRGKRFKTRRGGLADDNMEEVWQVEWEKGNGDLVMQGPDGGHADFRDAIDAAMKAQID